MGIAMGYQIRPRLRASSWRNGSIAAFAHCELIFPAGTCFAAAALTHDATCAQISPKNEPKPMRALVSLYLVIGIVLLAIGFLATGPCPNKNTDIVNDVVFVLTWPVGVYGYVTVGTMTPLDWLHKQACEGGLGPHGDDLPKPADQPKPVEQ
jgi:hypothetical protein